MSVSAAFAVVVAIWSTTPMAIKWSSDGAGPFGGLFFRMAVASLVGWLIVKLTRRQFAWHSAAWRYYMIANVGFVGGIISVYFASGFVATGVMSLVFGLSPVVSSFVARIVLREAPLTGWQWGGFAMAFIGLTFVFYQQLEIRPHAWIGLILLIISVNCFSVSSVYLKRYPLEADLLSKTVACAICALPIIALIWLIASLLSMVGWHESSGIEPIGADPHIALPLALFDYKTMGAIAYLGIFGSLLGFACYFYVLQHMSATRVALATLLAPVFALGLGAWLENESLTIQSMIGAVLVLGGLASFHMATVAVDGNRR